MSRGFIDSQPRPQDPRFTGDIAETRKKYHDDANSMYGKVENGVLLGQGAPTAGDVSSAENHYSKIRQFER